MPAGPPILAIGILGSILVFFLAWRRPTIALAVWLVFTTVFSEYVLLPTAATLHVHLSRVLLTAAILGLAAGWVPRTTRVTTPFAPAALIAILTVWTILTAAYTGTLFRSDGERNLSVFLTGFFLPGMVLYFARYFPLTIKISRTVTAILTALTIYMIFTAFVEHFHIEALVFPKYILDQSLGIHTERARGPIINAAENGGIIAILLLIALHHILYAVNGVMRWVLCGALLLAGGPALFFTQTRGPWLAFAGGFAVMVLHKRFRPMVMGAGGIGGLALAAFLIVSAASAGDIAKKDPLPGRSDNTSDTADFRKDLYRESVRPFQDHPLVGWGLGTFTDEDYLFDGYGGSLTITTAVLHDTVVAITLESGIPGGLLYLAFLITLTVMLLKIRKKAPSVEMQDFCTMAVATIAAMCINGLFVDIRYFLQQNALVYFVGGLGLAFAAYCQSPQTATTASLSATARFVEAQ